jgi:hypothetical protein
MSKIVIVILIYHRHKSIGLSIIHICWAHIFSALTSNHSRRLRLTPKGSTGKTTYCCADALGRVVSKDATARCHMERTAGWVLWASTARDSRRINTAAAAAAAAEAGEGGEKLTKH